MSDESFQMRFSAEEVQRAAERNAPKKDAFIALAQKLERDRNDAEAYRWMRPLMDPFCEWAQQVLDAGRWAGHDYYSAVRTEFEEMQAELREIAAFAAAHHGDESPHVWLHALTIDIPESVRRFLARYGHVDPEAGTQKAGPVVPHDFTDEDVRVLRALYVEHDPECRSARSGLTDDCDCVARAQEETVRSLAARIGRIVQSADMTEASRG